MQNLFNMDNPIMQELSRFADMMIVNLLFVLCALPIITIGASYTALCSVIFKMVKKEETHVCADFFKAFAANIKQSTFLWIITAVVSILLAVNVRFAFTASGAILRIVTIAACALFFMVAQYLFPYVARFQDKTGTVIKNCVLIAMAHLPGTIFCCVVAVAAVWVSFLNEQVLAFAIFAWTVIGFSALAYINISLFQRIFAVYEPKESELGQAADHAEGEGSEETGSDS